MFLRPSIIAAVGFAVTAAAAVLGLSLDRDEPGDLPPPAAVGALPPPRPFSDRRLPAIDVLRVGAGGDAMIAGRALPGASVRLHDAGRNVDLGRVAADRRGEWVVVPELPLAAGVRLLVAQSDAGGAVASGDPVVVVVPADGQGGAVAVEVPAQGGSRLLLGPAPGGTGLDIRVVDRDEDGRLTVGGRAAADATLRLYVDNRFVGRARAGGDGGWRLAARAPRHGRHALRADAVDSRGKVCAGRAGLGGRRRHDAGAGRGGGQGRGGFVADRAPHRRRRHRLHRDLPVGFRRGARSRRALSRAGGQRVPPLRRRRQAGCRALSPGRAGCSGGRTTSASRAR